MVLAIALTVIFSFLGSGIMLFRVDPFEAGLAAKIIFFAVSFLGICSLLTLVIFFIWRGLSKESDIDDILKKFFWSSLFVAVVLFVWLIVGIMF